MIIDQNVHLSMTKIEHLYKFRICAEHAWQSKAQLLTRSKMPQNCLILICLAIRNRLDQVHHHGKSLGSRNFNICVTYKQCYSQLNFAVV